MNTNTVTMLYHLVQCPHRFFPDLHEDPSKKDCVSPSVHLRERIQKQRPRAESASRCLPSFPSGLILFLYFL